MKNMNKTIFITLMFISTTAFAQYFKSNKLSLEDKQYLDKYKQFGRVQTLN